MTPTITQKIIGTISETDYELLSSTVGVVMIVLLLSLLISRRWCGPRMLPPKTMPGTRR